MKKKDEMFVHIVKAKDINLPEKGEWSYSKENVYILILKLNEEQRKNMIKSKGEKTWEEFLTK